MDYQEFSDLKALGASAAITPEQVINASRSVWRYVCKLSDALRNGDAYRASLAELALEAMDFTLRNLGFDSFLPADAQWDDEANAITGLTLRHDWPGDGEGRKSSIWVQFACPGKTPPFLADEPTLQGCNAVAFIWDGSRDGEIKKLLAWSQSNADPIELPDGCREGTEKEALEKRIAQIEGQNPETWRQNHEVHEKER